jgi:hypothetical protein
MGFVVPAGIEPDPNPLSAEIREPILPSADANTVLLECASMDAPTGGRPSRAK